MYWNGTRVQDPFPYLPEHCGIPYLCGQGFEILIASNHLENLFDGDFAEGDKRGRSHQSALFVFDGSDRWHKIGHSVVV